MRDALPRRISDARLHQEVGRTSNEQLVRSSQLSGSGGDGGGIFEN